jgi:hypothetical protein
MTLNTYHVASRVMVNGKQSHTTSDEVNAASAEAARAKIEARGDHVVTSVSYVCKWL